MTKLKTLFILMLVMALGIVSACKDDEPETEQERKTRQISKSWRVNSVTLAGSTDNVLNGVATFSFNADGSYTISNPAALPRMQQPNPHEPLPASGTWQFTGSDFNSITLTGTSSSGAAVSVPLTITNLTDTNFTFTYPGAEPKATDPVMVTVVLVP